MPEYRIYIEIATSQIERRDECMVTIGIDRDPSGPYPIRPLDVYASTADSILILAGLSLLL